MKPILYTPAALEAFGKLSKSARSAILAKLERYAESGAGSVRSLVGRPGARPRAGDYRIIFVETAAAIEVLAVGDRRHVYARGEGGMTPQYIRTEGGEDLVVLTRRAYDALLARLGDDVAEDRASAHMVDDYIAGKTAGKGASIPHWFVLSVAEHGSGAKAARRHAGASRKDVARAVGSSRTRLAEIEHGRAELSDAQRRILAELTGIESDWLV